MQPDETAASCPSCQARYHRDCWDENGGCAVYGCNQVAATEKRGSLEIPVSYWGQEDKPCPACGHTILAAAVRCRYCGTTFESARPQGSDDFRQRLAQKQRLPVLQRTIIALFALSVLPCTAPLAAVGGGVWYLRHRADLRALPALYLGLCRLALLVAAGQSAFTILMAVLFFTFRS